LQLSTEEIKEPQGEVLHQFQTRSLEQSSEGDFATRFGRWKLPNRSDKALEDLSRMFNPIIRG
jgi:hypothetical protein